MKKLFFILLSMALLFSCKTMKGSAKNEKDSVKDSNNMTSKENESALAMDRYYELVGIKNQDEFIKIEPSHGGGGLILFKSDGRFSSTSGLNIGNGYYKYKKTKSGFDKIAFGKFGLTLMLGANEQENFFDSLFFSQIEASRYAQVEGKILRLYDANKNLVLSFYLK